MKILLANHFPLEGSGSGVYTKNIAQRLHDMGCKVKVIVVDNEINMDYDFPVRTILYQDFPCFTTHPKSSNTFYNLSREETNHYLNLFERTIREETEEFKPDIIHCQHLWVAPYAASKTGVPYIITAHGTDIKGFKKDKRYRNIALKGALNAERVITISRQVHEDVKKYYELPEKKLKLILNGFDENIFKTMDISREEVLQEVLNTDRPIKAKHVVSFVGKLTEFKGVDLLLKAAAIYEKELPGTITLITGHGHLYDELKELAAKLKLNSVYFIGNRPQTTVAKINNIADAAVVPSRVEPFGLVAIEAMACGTPVIATNAGGLPDFIDDKVGKLIPMDDHRALAAAVIESLKNNHKATKGRYAAEYAAKNFSWDRALEKLLDIYRKI